MDAFDADVLIYAAVPGHPLGRRVRALFDGATSDLVGIGSVLLLPELLTKPRRAGRTEETLVLARLLARLHLRPADRATAALAVVLGADHGLKPIDALHLATAVAAGADRFVTNNRRDFDERITEVDIVHPDHLPDPDGPDRS